MKTCDIIIPAYNSERTLSHTLRALQDQKTFPGWMYRAIVVDDASTDGTPAVASQFTWKAPWRTPTVLSITHSGQGEARNVGVQHSDADIILMLGSDIQLRKGALYEHIAFHEHMDDAWAMALGGVRWDPRLPPSPLMEWMIHGGQQNDFDAVIGSSSVDPSHFFYASHMSMKRGVFEHISFSSDFTTYGWEDIDMGMQAAAQGATLYVLHSAIGLHTHIYTSKDILRRQYLTGASMHTLVSRHPEENLVERPTATQRLKRRVYRAWIIRYSISVVMRIVAPMYTCPRLFLIATAGEFWRGWYDAKQ